ncbi:hypothetical protein OF83DRAFT_784842 [Amylostereum chailletii]|nr:hypothetical protein OF83DRAFT_784842 [Amylostereum chailletii]
MSDSIVLWRACVVWGMRRSMRIISVFLVLAQICLWIVYMIGAAIALPLSGIPASFQPLIHHSANVAINALSFSLSVVANIWATAMIAYKAWLVAVLSCKVTLADHHRIGSTGTTSDST